MKRFTVLCDFNGQKAPFHIYIGEPDPRKHPLQNQARWLSVERSGRIPEEVMKSVEKLHDIANQNKVSFEELCVYAFGTNAEHAAKPDHIEIKRLDEKIANCGKHLRSIRNNSKIETSDKPRVTRPKIQKESIAKSLLNELPRETIAFLYKTGKLLWPDNHELADHSRMLFLAVGLEIAVRGDKKLSLSEIYRSLTAEDLPYSLVVILDTMGKKLPPIAYRLISEWLRYERRFRERIVLYMTTRLIDAAMAGGKGKAKLPEAMRQDIYHFIFEADISAPVE